MGKIGMAFAFMEFMVVRKKMKINQIITQLKV